MTTCLFPLWFTQISQYFYYFSGLKKENFSTEIMKKLKEFQYWTKNLIPYINITYYYCNIAKILDQEAVSIHCNPIHMEFVQ